MLRNKKKGFTLVELLAVIVILAIILVIAVPQIMKTIDSAREGALSSSAKLIAASAEREYLVRKTLGDTSFQGLDSIPCAEVAEVNDNDYEDCTVTFDSNGKATVRLVGKGKFAGKNICNGTRTGANVTEDACGLVCAVGTTKVKSVTYEIKDKASCTRYLTDIYTDLEWEEYIDEEVPVICSGEPYYEDTLYEEFDWIMSEANLTEQDLIDNNVIKVTIEEECITLESCFAFDNGSITGYDSTCGTDVVIPDTIDNVSVVSIGASAFEEKGLKGIYLPNTVTTIGEGAFYGNNISGELDLSNLTNLQTVEEGAFEDNNISSIYLPNTVTTIGAYAFYGNENLETIYNTTGQSFDWDYIINGREDARYTFEKGLVTNEVFNTTIEVLTNWCYKFENGTITKYDSTCGSEVNIPNMIDGVIVTTIGENAFANTDITKVTLPASVTTLEKNAFLKSNTSNNNLSEIKVTSLREFNWGLAINGVTNEKYVFNAGIVENSVGNVTISTSATNEACFAFEDGAITGYDISCGTDIIIPSTIDGSSVTAIGDMAFTDCGSSVEQVSMNLDNLNVTSLKTEYKNISLIPILAACSGVGLTSVYIPSSITYIGVEAFTNNRLTNVVFEDTLTRPSQLERIERSAFNTNNLTDLIIPSSVTYIGNYAFRYNDLANLYLGNINVEFGSCSFGYQEDIETHNLPDAYTYTCK